MFIVVDFVPYFTQNPTSYISYDTLQDAYVDFDVEVSFIPHVTDGKTPHFTSAEFTQKKINSASL